MNFEKRTDELNLKMQNRGKPTGDHFSFVKAYQIKDFGRDQRVSEE
jgi:hypothetical protein